MIQYLMANSKLQFYHMGCYVRIVGGETFQTVGSVEHLCICASISFSLILSKNVALFCKDN